MGVCFTAISKALFPIENILYDNWILDTLLEYMDNKMYCPAIYITMSTLGLLSAEKLYNWFIDYF